MTSAEAIQELLASPELPNAVAQLSSILESERRRRERFYEEITPEMKAEFINGEVIVHSPVTLNHLNASANLLLLLRAYARRKEMGQVYSEKALVVLARNDYEPDITFYSNEKAARFEGDQLKFPAPDLAIEILSPSTEQRDRGIKFKDYATHGVQEYWIVNAESRQVEQYRLEQGSYKLVVKSNSGDVESSVITGFRIPVRAIFDNDLALETLKGFLL